MKKITTVLIAMLLLTLSVLAAHADQEGNARWCNIDSHGCYLNEEGGIKSYMHFWSEESCRHFMGNDDPCKNVVARYDKDPYRQPLEPAPEPIVYKPKPKKLVKPLEEIPELEELEELLGDNFPDTLTMGELKEILQNIHNENIAEEKVIELVEDVIKPDESLKEIFEDNFRGHIKIVKGIVFLTDGSTATNTESYTPISSLSVFSQNEGDILLVPVIQYKAKEMLDTPMDQAQVKELNRGALGILTDNNGGFFNSVIAPGLDPKSSNYLDYELIGFTIPETAGVDDDTFSLDDNDVEEISGDDPEYIRDEEGNVVAVEQSFSDSANPERVFSNLENTTNNQDTTGRNNFEGEKPKLIVMQSGGGPNPGQDNGLITARIACKKNEDIEEYNAGIFQIPNEGTGPEDIINRFRSRYSLVERTSEYLIAHQ